MCDYDFKYIKKMKLYHVTSMIAKSIERRRIDDLYSLYINVYPYFNEETFMTFEEFKNDAMKSTVENDDERSEEEILMNVKDIMNNYELEGGEV